jgi:hypothetical protein
MQRKVPKLSIVLPLVGKDDETEWGSLILENLEDFQDEIEIVYGKGENRGERLQDGINNCSSPLILLHHPRSLVEKAGIAWLLQNHENSNLSWGGFHHQFDNDHWLLRFTSWWSNYIRSRYWSIVYLDHCIFFRRYLLIRPIPPVPIFEDTELCYILKESSGRKPLIISDYKSITSAIRFMKNGM